MADDKTTMITDELVKKIKVTFDKVLSYDDWQNAYALVRKIEPVLLETPQRIPQDFRDELKDLIIKGKWISLPALNDGEVVELFGKYFKKQFELIDGEFDIWNKLKAKLINIPMYNDRDTLRKKIKETLLNSEEEITSTGPLGDENKQLAPTIKNWLIDYTKNLGTEEKNTVMINNYIIKHNIINKLPETEKNNLKKLFNFYEIVKISSLDPEGYEENVSVIHPEWGPGIMVAGKFIPRQSSNDMQDYIEESDNLVKEKQEKIPVVENVASEDIDEKQNIKHKNGKEELQLKWQKFLKNWLMVEVMEAIEKNSSKDVYKMEDVRSQFYHAVNKHDAKDALVSLLVIAEHGNIKQAFGDDERYQKFWGSYLESSFAKATEDERNNLDDGQFKKDPAQVKYLAMFFKYIMEERLKLDQDQAVMIGAMLANLCRQAQEVEYQQMAYGDIESGEFKWNI